MKIIISLVFFLTFIQGSFAGDHILQIEGAWTRPVIIKNHPGVVYFTINNATNRKDTLVSASSPLAEKIEFHRTEYVDKIMRMIAVKEISVAAHAMTAVEPGGYHLMIFGLKKNLAIGDSLPLVLTFKNAGTIRVIARVRKKAPKLLEQ